MCPFVVRKPHTTRGFVGALRRVRLSGGVQRLPRFGHRSAARSCTSEPLRARKRAALNGVARTRVLPTSEAVLCRFRFSAKGQMTGPTGCLRHKRAKTAIRPARAGPHRHPDEPQRPLPATMLPTVAKPRASNEVPRTSRTGETSRRTGDRKDTRPIKRNRPRQLPGPVAASVSRAGRQEANRYRPATPRRVPPSRPS